MWENMFREMRRSGQRLSEEETRGILVSGTTGILTVLGDDGYPYGVPVNYTCRGDSIYIHSAQRGHKIDAVLRNARVGFTVIAEDEVVPATFSTNYRSAIAFGSATMVNEAAEKRQALLDLLAKYSPQDPEAGIREIETDWDRVCIIKIRLEHMSGKAARALVNPHS